MKAVITVLGKDRVGIIAGITAALAQNQVNILDISQTILQDYFTMIMLVDLDRAVSPFATLRQVLDEEGERLGVSIRIQQEDIFKSMHHI